MTSSMTATSAPPRRLGRSVASLALGFVTVVVLSVAMALGVVGTVLGTAGAVATIHLGPAAWYPIAIAITALPCGMAGRSAVPPNGTLNDGGFTLSS
jgi:hypothetical protein